MKLFFAGLLFIQVMAFNILNASMPDYYSEAGSNSGRVSDKNISSEESIDPFGGALQLHYIDQFLPGNGGLGIAVQRNYHNKNSKNIGFGVGWNINFGEIVLTGVTPSVSGCNKTGNVSSVANPVLVLQDGTRQLLVDANSSSYNLISTQQWIAKCSGSTPIVYSPDGTKYEFGDSYFNAATMNLGRSSKHYLVTKITDANNNYLTISYKSYTQSINKFISTIQSNDGRQVNFYYVEKGTYKTVMLDRVSANGKTVKYQYAQKYINGQISVGEYNLTKVTRADNSFYTYTYYGDPTNTLDGNAYLLKTVLTPEKLKTQYKYKRIIWGLFETQENGLGTATGSQLEFAVVEKATSGGGVSSGIWRYTYNPGSQSGGGDKTTVATPIGKIEYLHYGAKYAQNNRFNQAWRIGLLYEKRMYSGSSLTQTEKMEWSKKSISNQNTFDRGVSGSIDQYTYMPVLTKKTIKRDGATYSVSYSGHDSYGNPSTMTELGTDSRSTSYTYSNNTSKWIIGLVTKESISGVGSIYRTFDSAGNMTSKSVFGVKNTFTYSSGNLSSHTDPRGNRSTFSSYYRGTPRAESHPEGGSIARSVNTTGTISSETNAGRRTSYSYNNVNRLTSVSYPRGSSASLSWSYSSGLRGSYSRSGLQNVTSLDAMGNIKSNTLDGVTTTYRNNAAGQQTFASLPGKSVGNTYIKDILGRIKAITRSDGKRVTYTYSGSTMTVNNERGINTQYTYKTFGTPDERYVTRISSSGILTSISRNKLGIITRLTQGGITRSYGYNSKFFLTSISNPETGTTTFTRDSSGNMLSKTVGGKRTSYTYDGQNRVKTIQYSGSATAYFTYYASGNLKTANKAGVNWTYNYDNNNNLTQERLTVDGRTYITNYAYDSRDGLSSTSYPGSGPTISYSPDNLGRPTKSGAYVTSASYHPSGHLKAISYGNGKATNISLDSRLRTDVITSSGVMGLDYTYDGSSNITNIRNTLNSQQTKSYTYDGVDRLTSESGSTISYDSAGNITRKNIGGKNLSYIYSANKLQSVKNSGTSIRSFQYDGFGNVTANGVDVFDYDGASDLVGIANQSIEYEYDAHHQRIVQTTAAGKKYSIYDKSGKLLLEDTPSAGIKKNYIYLGGLLVAQAGSCSTSCDTSETDTSETDTSETDTSETDTSETDTSETDTSETDTSENDTSENDTSETGLPIITLPPSGSTLSSATQTFSWNSNGNDAIGWALLLGSAPGERDIASQWVTGSGSSYAIGNLPVDGRAIYVTLAAQYADGWVNYDPIQYTASSGSSVDTHASPVLVSPTGSISNSTPTFTWNAVANSTQYVLRVYDSAGVSLLYRGMSPSDLNCLSGNVCTYEGLNLAEGAYTWKVRAQDGSIVSEYSPVRNFTVGASDVVGLPVITSPTSGSTLSSATQTFNWNSNGNDAIGWALLVGSAPGERDIASQWITGSESSYTLGSLPLDGRIVYVTLAAQYANGWVNYDPIQYTASSGSLVDTHATPVLVSPTGSISSSTPIFTWNAVANSTQYILRIYNSEGVSLSYTGYSPSQVNCPNGEECTYGGMTFPEGAYAWKVQAQSGSIVSEYSSVENFTIGADNGVGLPIITSPTSRSTLSSETQTFAWNSNGNDAIGWALLVGSIPGERDIASQWVTGSERSYTLGNLPVDGRTVYVTLAAQYADGWVNYEPIEYTASSGASVDTQAPPVLVSPAGSTSNSTPTFTWNSVASTTIYTLRVYDSAGVSLLYRGVNSSEVNCSNGGVCAYAGLTLAEGAYTWKVKSNAGGGEYSPIKNFTVVTGDVLSLPVITSPTSGSTLSSATQTFNWNSNGNDAIGWALLVGTTPGERDIANQWITGSGSSYTLGNLPVDGRTVYVTLAAQYTDGWVNYDAIQYTASGGGSISVAPEVPTVNSPTGSTSGPMPSYRWNAVPGATSYLIGVENITNSNWQSVEVPSVQAGCAGSGACLYRPSTSDMTLATGDSYIWWIKAKNSVGESGWSSGLNFMVTQ